MWCVTGPCILDVHFWIMLVVNMFALVGRVGDLIFDASSIFGCLTAGTFLAEYLIFVPSATFCSYWIKLHQLPMTEVEVEERASAPVTMSDLNDNDHVSLLGADHDSDFGVQSASEHDVDRY